MIPVLACGGTISSFALILIGLIVFAPSWISAVTLFASICHRVAIRKPTSIRYLMSWMAIVAVGISGQIAVLSHIRF